MRRLPLFLSALAFDDTCIVLLRMQAGHEEGD
jgi:hypothetical protein